MAVLIFIIPLIIIFMHTYIKYYIIIRKSASLHQYPILPHPPICEPCSIEEKIPFDHLTIMRESY